LWLIAGLTIFVFFLSSGAFKITIGIPDTDKPTVGEECDNRNKPLFQTIYRRPERIFFSIRYPDSQSNNHGYITSAPEHNE
jgi:hypothetical protein